MSKIEVDAIDKQSGSTLTLGGSGTAVTLGTGATQSGFGRTGTVDWQTGSIKTATFTAANGEGYFANTAGGAFEMDLPAGSAGAIVSVQDYNNTFDTHALTVDPNGSEKINGGTGGESVTLNTEGRGVTFIYIDATVGWRSVQDNDFSKAGAPPAAFITATGGTITTVCTNFKVHTFTGPGTFTVCSAGNAAGSNTVDYLVVAGGGASVHDRGGGGGAGGYRESSGAASGCYTASPLGGGVSALPVTATGFPITVGSGGVADNSPPYNPGLGGNGNNSIFSTIISTGGGGGNRASPQNGSPGGSGGGAGINPVASPQSGTGGSGNTPPVSPAQGQNGGNSNPCTPAYATGAGGGATAVGQNGSGPKAGGAGATSSINGTPTARAGGGGGMSGGPAGPGGGGAGGTNCSAAGGNGTINTGSGGGGGASNTNGGTGGSGIVIIRYKFQ